MALGSNPTSLYQQLSFWGPLVAAVWHLVLTTGYGWRPGVPHLARELAGLWVPWCKAYLPSLALAHHLLMLTTPILQMK